MCYHSFSAFREAHPVFSSFIVFFLAVIGIMFGQKGRTSKIKKNPEKVDLHYGRQFFRLRKSFSIVYKAGGAALLKVVPDALVFFFFQTRSVLRSTKNTVIFLLLSRSVGG